MESLPPLPEYELKPLPSLVPGIPDPVVALSGPIIAYWVLSIFFHIIGKVVGLAVDLIILRPVNAVATFNFAQAGPYVGLAMVIVLVGYLSQRSLLDPFTH